MAVERVRDPHHSKGAEVPGCLFCGAIVVWWDCRCSWAELIREGKLPRPKTVMRNGVPIIECCAELRAAARLAGVISVVDAVPRPVDAPVSIEVTAVDADGAVDGADVDAASTETEDDRLRRLKRERQQRWRARGKE